MKSYYKLLTVLLLGTVLFQPNMYAQKSEAKKNENRATKAKEEVTDAIAEVEKIFEEKECIDFKNSDLNKIQKAIRKAKAEAALARAAAEAATTAVGNTRGGDDKREARNHEHVAKVAADAAEQALKDILEKLPGIKKADEIIKALDDYDIPAGSNSEKEKIVERLKKAAENAGYKHPCDPDLVKDDVEDAFDEELRKFNGNGELKPWIEELKKKFKDEHLISYEFPDRDAFVGRQDAHAIYTAELFSGKTQSQGPETDHYGQYGFTEMQQYFYSDPALYGQLAESLGGEFFFGDFSQPVTEIQLQTVDSRMVGLTLQAGVVRGFIGEVSYMQQRSDLTGLFPVTVIDDINGETQSLDGSLSYRQKVHTGRLGLGYRLGNDRVALLATGGLQFSNREISGGLASIGEITISTAGTDSVRSTGPYAKMGIEVYPVGRCFIRTTLFAGSGKVRTGPDQTSNSWTPGVSVGLGIGF